MQHVARVALVAALALPAPAVAADLEGVHLDDKVIVDGHDLVLNGAGVRKRLVFKVYVGSLYVADKARTAPAVLAQTPRRIRLDVLRKLAADQLIAALVEGLKNNTTAEESSALAVPIGEMAAIMKSFGQAKEGSVVTLDFIDAATRISLDGDVRGTIDGAAFGDALTRIWIGDHPAQADLRKAMLGGA